MKLVELLANQRLTVQLLWGEQKIEFFSNVVETDESAAYISPYLHNGGELELNVTPNKDVICNIFTNNPSTKQRISWKNVELTTITRKDKVVYCIKTNGYNHIAKHDDRRKHDRLIITAKAQVYEGKSDECVNIVVHDISDIGISFYAPNSFEPNEHQLTVAFSDYIGEKVFNIKVECAIARMTNKVGNRFIGCKILKENKDYQLYSFMKRLEGKSKGTAPKDDVESK